MTVKDMLLQLRRPHKHRYLWIDAICLNQKDGDEKAQQIPLMGEIYSQADKLHIWLGPDDGEEMARVFAFLHVLGCHRALPNWRESSRPSSAGPALG
jgi:hypothetical protein